MSFCLFLFVWLLCNCMLTCSFCTCGYTQENAPCTRASGVSQNSARLCADQSFCKQVGAQFSSAGRVQSATNSNGQIWIKNNWRWIQLPVELLLRITLATNSNGWIVAGKDSIEFVANYLCGKFNWLILLRKMKRECDRALAVNGYLARCEFVNGGSNQFVFAIEGSTINGFRVIWSTIRNSA